MQLTNKSRPAAWAVLTSIAAGSAMAAPPPIIVNEYNAVGSSKYTEDAWFDADTRGDLWVAENYPQLDQVMPAGSPLAGQLSQGRIQGNLGDWVELVILKDNTDIRGWSLQMAQLRNTGTTNGQDLWLPGEPQPAPTVTPVPDGDREQSIVTFSNDARWSNLRAGTIITVSEQSEIGVDTRTGIVNGDNRDDWGSQGKTYWNLTRNEIDLNENPQDAFRDEAPGGYEPDVFIDLTSQTDWDPVGSGTPQNPGADADWWIHVSTKDERDKANPLVTTQNNILDDDGTVKGSDLFDIGNDHFLIRIVDENGDVATDLVGEPGRDAPSSAQAWFDQRFDSDSVGWNGSGLNSRELGKLEEDPFYTTTVDFGGGPVEIEFNVLEANYNDGKSSTFGSPNTFGTGTSGNPQVQDFSLIREWLANVPVGDTDLDLDVDSADATSLSGNWTGTLTPGTVDRRWSQGDFDDDGDVDSTDSTLQLGNWTGSVAAVAATLAAPASFTPGDDRADLIYDPATGNVKLDATDVGQIISFFLEGDGEVFDPSRTNLPFINTGTNTDNVAIQIGQTDVLNVGFTGVWDLGDVLEAGLTQSELEALFLRAGYVFALGQGVQSFDVGLVPEPASLTLLAMAGMLLVSRRRRAA